MALQHLLHAPCILVIRLGHSRAVPFGSREDEGEHAVRGLEARAFGELQPLQVRREGVLEFAQLLPRGSAERDQEAIPLVFATGRVEALTTP